MGARNVIFRFQATDDLSGVGAVTTSNGFLLQFQGPNNQSLVYGGCALVQGTALNGFWECAVTVPSQAATGTWQITYMRIPDRAANGGFSSFSYFITNGAGQLCNQSGNCVASPTVEVTSLGDNEPPTLQALGIVANQADVATSLDFTDNISGVSYAWVTYTSTQASQFQQCFTSLTAGTPMNGTWACTINFPQFAARGQWVLSLTVVDVAGNVRYYYRRATDGYLCYYDPSAGTVCQDFGDTDIILP
jgi:hypothetical protein